MNTSVEFPEMRAEVLGALRALSDSVHQHTRWGRYVPGIEYYDDLDMNIHILYDDCRVLPSPERAAPQILYSSEIPALRSVSDALGPILHELGDSPDTEYINNPQWANVLHAASVAVAIMHLNDQANKDR